MSNGDEMNGSRLGFEAAVAQHRLVAVLRGVADSGLEGMIQALLDSGVRLIEVACSTPNAFEQVERLVRFAKGKAFVGAGTILNAEMAARALDAGAEFLVTPHVALDAIEFALAHDLGILCGALTPTEIMTARAAGVRFIKLFPVTDVSPEYVKALLGPYPDLELLVVGGVGSHNLAPYLKAGAIGAGVGGSLTRLDANDPEFTAVKREATALVKLLARD
ncbi:MAG: bifunctional 4-hydroxy-2-oxoglutarate aldolase/2-dehydro-3-deoxy-phosphogluconate aldolase [Trueperaceae bacterium]|nr:bifunctional 4-hydroxy-2-oxoglutarate aldolase/2-dehydro-3-deoxy-phosphogluconate aldolase [Trueperaceae bacterium]